MGSWNRVEVMELRENLGCILESRTIGHGHELDVEVQIINN